MSSRLGGTDLRAWSLFIALTVPAAVLAHLAFDLVDAGCSWSVLARPAHLALAALVVASLGAAVFGLGAGLPPAERRRRRALLRAGVAFHRSPRRSAACTVAIQAVIVAATLPLDGIVPGPSRLAFALAAALLSIAVGAWTTRALRAAVAAAVAPAAARRPSRPLRAARRAFVAAPARRFALFRPNRPPPLPSAV